LSVFELVECSPFDPVLTRTAFGLSVVGAYLSLTEPVTCLCFFRLWLFFFAFAFAFVVDDGVVGVAAVYVGVVAG